MERPHLSDEFPGETSALGHSKPWLRWRLLVSSVDLSFVSSVDSCAQDFVR